MPKRKGRVPSYRLHKPSGQARVIINREHIYLGPYGSPKIHGASYLVGVTGGSLLIFRIWRERGRPRVLTVFPMTRAAVVRAVILIAIAALIIWFRFTAT